MNRLSKILQQNSQKADENSQTKVEKTPSDTVAIEIKDLKKSYGKFEVLNGVSIKVKEGEAYGLIGRNGIGKSTTIDCMVGLKPFNDGSISIFDHDVTREPIECKKLFGYVASEPTTYEVMTGKDFLSFVAGAYGVSQNDFVVRYRVMAERLSFKDSDLSKRIREYSHGMKQKLCLIASLIHNPKIWVLDEPTVGLDLVVSDMLFSMMYDLKTEGRTLFITSHNIDFVSKICDRVGILDNGVIKREIDFRDQPSERRRLKEIFKSFQLEEEKG